MLKRSRRNAISVGDLVVFADGPFRDFAGVALTIEPDGLVLIRIEDGPPGFFLRVHERYLNRKTGRPQVPSEAAQ
jgi:hypothetical protein